MLPSQVRHLMWQSQMVLLLSTFPPFLHKAVAGGALYTISTPGYIRVVNKTASFAQLPCTQLTTTGLDCAWDKAAGIVDIQRIFRPCVMEYQTRHFHTKLMRKWRIGSSAKQYILQLIIFFFFCFCLLHCHYSCYSSLPQHCSRQNKVLKKIVVLKSHS